MKKIFTNTRLFVLGSQNPTTVKSKYIEKAGQIEENREDGEKEEE